MGGVRRGGGHAQGFYGGGRGSAFDFNRIIEKSLNGEKEIAIFFFNQNITKKKKQVEQ